MKNRIQLFLFFFICTILIIGAKEWYPFAKGMSKESKNRPSKKRLTDLQSGDLLFQTSLSEQSVAIQYATDSKYSHVGILYQKDKKFYVLEAVQPVKLTPLDEWIKRGKDNHYVVKRLKNADQILTPDVLMQMKNIGESYLGKNYDLYFEWTDDKIYCSELVWKIYSLAAGIELGRLQKLSEFNLKQPLVKVKLKERYGNQIPWNENVISPARIYESELLETIESN